MLSVESAGTLPCTPEIPDCAEQVRSGRPEASRERVEEPPEALPWPL